MKPRVPAARRPASKAWRYPTHVAHRGAGKLAPENTLAAMRLGAEYGYRMAEFDVKLSADGVPFLLHDSTLDRTTNARGRADALTWRELALLDAGGWHSQAYAGEPLASLAAIAAFSRATDIAVNIEIKPTRGRERETGAAVAFDAAALWKGAALPPLLSSFSEASLVAAREAVPELPIAYLAEVLPGDWRERVTALGCVAIDLKHTSLTRSIVDDAHALGVAVATWTVNEPARARMLLGWGVDCVITDAVDRIRPRR